MSRYEDWITSVTVIGMERTCELRSPNGIQCDECGSRVYWDRREFPQGYDEARGLGWTEFLCPDCNLQELKPTYPSNPILLPSGAGVLCPQCHRRWDPGRGESPNCVECAAAWHVIENQH